MSVKILELLSSDNKESVVEGIDALSNEYKTQKAIFDALGLSQDVATSEVF